MPIYLITNTKFMPESSLLTDGNILPLMFVTVPLTVFPTTDITIEVLVLSLIDLSLLWFLLFVPVVSCSARGKGAPPKRTPAW